MASFLFWQRWLFVVGLVVAVFGIMMALTSGTVLFELFNHQIDPAFWGTAIIGNEARQFKQWIYGVWGSTIAGWGVFLAFVAQIPFNKKERWAWNCLVTGLLVWFVLDTSLSLYYKVYFNVAFNTALLVLAGLPVVFTRKSFGR
jgi:hypothetical protein